MNLYRAVGLASRWHGNWQQFAGATGLRKALLLPRRFQMLDRGHDPELQQARRIFLRRIVFGVAHSGSRTHSLDFAGADDASVAHIVAVFDGPFNDVGDDFHLPMRVEGEAASR